MLKPHFIFTRHKEHISVYVQNLEKLSVVQIKNIEAFVHVRNGHFDFTTYTFTLNKKLELTEFIKLLQTLHVEASVEEDKPMLLSNARIGFGQYKGLYYIELPDSYLLWLRNNYVGNDREIICNEIIRRKL